MPLPKGMLPRLKKKEKKGSTACFSALAISFVQIAIRAISALAPQEITFELQYSFENSLYGFFRCEQTCSQDKWFFVVKNQILSRRDVEKAVTLSEVEIVVNSHKLNGSYRKRLTEKTNFFAKSN